MTDQFQSARQKDMRFLKSIPDFVYEYKETDEIDGRLVRHIGEGVYIFEEPLPFGDGSYIETLQKKYPDLMFLVYRRQENIPGGGFPNEKINESSEIRLLLFAMSAHYIRHTADTLQYALLHEPTRFVIPADNMEIINDFLYYSDPDNNKLVKDCMIPKWYVFFESYYQPDYHHLWDTVETDCDKEVCPKGDEKLRFQFTPDYYERINGWRPYCLCQGRIAKYVYPGIYHFEDSLHLPENVSQSWENEERLYPCINPGYEDAEVWFGCLGREQWSGGTLAFLEGICARYIGFGKQALSILKQMESILPDYRFAKIIKRENNSMVSQLLDISVLTTETTLKAKSHVISEDAVELVKGEGFVISR